MEKWLIQDLGLEGKRGLENLVVTKSKENLKKKCFDALRMYVREPTERVPQG